MPEPSHLLALIAQTGGAERVIATRAHTLRLNDFETLSPFGAEATRFVGRKVLLAVQDMASAAAALIELDGLAGRIVLCPPGWSAAEMARAAKLAGCDALVCDPDAEPPLALPVCVRARWPLSPRGDAPARRFATEWVLPTSGTSGPPKLAVHTLATLVGAIAPAPLQQWATFYDIRRYGGLQILLRALAGQGSLQLSSPDERVEDYLARLGAAGVTHISGTPTHWRKALLSGAANRIAPAYVRLSGEIADDGVLESLRAAYPNARVEHAYASTEAGVGFAVDDGRAGFPAAWLDRAGPVEMKVIDGSLRLRSARRALELIGENAPVLVDDEGFVDTGDMIEVRGDRCLFLGRRGGIINIGGAKVHPEEVEAVLTSLDEVRAAFVFARPSPITGAIVAADVVARNPASAGRDMERAIIAAARKRLPAHSTPARIRFVAELPMTEAGKLKRHA